jgi:hypothetical protein
VSIPDIGTLLRALPKLQILDGSLPFLSPSLPSPIAGGLIGLMHAADDMENYLQSILEPLRKHLMHFILGCILQNLLVLPGPLREAFL